jgi:hypothetical protein
MITMEVGDEDMLDTGELSP